MLWFCCYRIVDSQDFIPYEHLKIWRAHTQRLKRTMHGHLWYEAPTVLVVRWIWDEKKSLGHFTTPMRAPTKPNTLFGKNTLWASKFSSADLPRKQLVRSDPFFYFPQIPLPVPPFFPHGPLATLHILDNMSHWRKHSCRSPGMVVRKPQKKW